MRFIVLVSVLVTTTAISALGYTYVALTINSVDGTHGAVVDCRHRSAEGVQPARRAVEVVPSQDLSDPVRIRSLAAKLIIRSKETDWGKMSSWVHSTPSPSPPSSRSHSPSPAQSPSQLPAQPPSQLPAQSPSQLSALHSPEQADQKKIPRPPNAFICFRRAKSEGVKREYSRNGNPPMTKLVSAVLGERWNALTDTQREPWYRQAAEAKAEHAKRYPGYKYQPKPKQPKKKGASIAETSRASGR